MPYDYQQVSKLSVDPRIVERIQRSPALMAEQGPGFMAAYGGPSNYIAASKLNSDERVAFYAMQDGFTTADDIALATGLDKASAAKALSGLNKKGMLVKETQEVPVE
jgi:hypothetical protein